MTPPNYFRFVRVDASSGGDEIYGDGSTLNFDENFDSSTWGVYNYSAGGFTSQRDDNFNPTDGWFDTGEWWS